MAKREKRIVGWEKVRLAADALGPEMTIQGIVDWVQAQFPGSKLRTIKADIYACTVNDESRVQYTINQKTRQADGDHDCLFNPEFGSGKRHRYDSTKHGFWETIPALSNPWYRINECSKKVGLGNLLVPQPPLAEDGYIRLSPGFRKLILPKHNALSNRFKQWLLGKLGHDRVTQEDNRVDIWFEHNNSLHVAELKTCAGVGTTKAIREALGQLLEYNLYPGRKAGSEWLVVLDSEPSDKDRLFMSRLVTNLKLPLRLAWETKGQFQVEPPLF